MSGPNRILLVEDDPEQLILYQQVLRKARYHVTAVLDAETALTELATGEFDLLLTDLLLPGINGDELITQIKASGNPMKTVLMSTHFGVRSISKACAADAYFPKGDIHHLPKILAELLTDCKPD